MQLFKKKEKEYSVLKKYQPVFKTVDGEIHNGQTYKWANASNLLCSVGEYLMININRSGYIEDNNSIMFPLTNVLSIEWKLLDRKTAEGDVSKYSMKTFFNDDELKGMKIVQ
ncbi:MAG: hypothetical protein K0R54_6150 [Clostridiaceae bacterium]|jgi:hypothetical protein|nr:hypothetical protein [Clostridiaceae bacterium]